MGDAIGVDDIAVEALRLQPNMMSAVGAPPEFGFQGWAVSAEQQDIMNVLGYWTYCATRDAIGQMTLLLSSSHT